MQQRRAALSLLAVIIVASGCAGNGGNTGSSTGAVDVTRLDVTPSSIRSGSTVRVEMGIANSGELPASLIIDRAGEIDGDAVLTDYCPDLFNIESFDAYSSSAQSTQDSYDLQRGEEVRLSWELKHTGDIGVNGAMCPMNFKVPFNYTVEAYRQVQILRNNDVGTADLSYQSSDGPLNILIETIGSSSEQGAPYFIEGDDVEVLVQLENTEPSEAEYSGAVNVQAPEITVPGSSEAFQLDSCNLGEDKEKMTLYEGESQVIRCDASYNLNAPSVTGEIRAKTNYTFIKNIGSQEVEVEYSGR